MKRYLAIDIGGTGIKYGLIDESAVFEDTHEMDTESHKGGPEILKKVLNIIEDYLDSELSGEDDRENTPKIEGVAISTAGMVNPETGEIFYASPLIPAYQGINYKKEVENRFHLPCEVENDVNCAGLAESISGASKGTHSSVMLTVGTGIGGCMILNNQVYHGFSNSACEVGYMRIDGDAYEKAGAASVMVKKVAERKEDPVDNWDGKKIFEFAKKGDDICVQAIEEMCCELAKGMANICYVVNPEMIVLGGGIMAQKEYLRDLLERELDTYLVESIRKRTKIAFAHHQNRAGMLGAFYNFQQKHPQ